MKYKFGLHLSALFSILFFTGCPKRVPKPNFEDTVPTLGSANRGADGGYGQSTLSPGESFEGDLSGLEIRDPESGNPNDFFKDGDNIGSSPYSEKQVLESVFFEFDQFYISNDARTTLLQLSRTLKSEPLKKVLLVGHCDWRGTIEYNTVLGDKRARSVMDYLVNLGVSSSQLETLSRGSLDATEGGSKQETRADRRVDIVEKAP